MRPQAFLLDFHQHTRLNRSKIDFMVCHPSCIPSFLLWHPYVFAQSRNMAVTPNSFPFLIPQIQLTIKTYKIGQLHLGLLPLYVGQIHLDAPLSREACPSLRRVGLFLLSRKAIPSCLHSSRLHFFRFLPQCLSPFQEKPFLISLHRIVVNHFTFYSWSFSLALPLCIYVLFFVYYVFPSKI